MAWQSEPDGIVWCVMEDGTLCMLTYERDQDVIAWSKGVVGGVDTVVESVATIPSATTTERDEVYLVVSRTVNSSTVRYIERVAGLYDGTDYHGMRFLDSWKYTDAGAATTSVTGLSHLEAESVYVHTENGTQGPYTVSSGAVTLGTASRYHTTGFVSDMEVELLPFEGGSPSGGTSQGKRKRAHQTGIRVKATRQLGYKTSNRSAYDILDFGSVSSTVDTFRPESTYGYEDTLQLKAIGGEELNILLLAPEVVVNQ